MISGVIRRTGSVPVCLRVGLDIRREYYCPDIGRCYFYEFSRFKEMHTRSFNTSNRAICTCCSRYFDWG